ncbi:putative ATP synthase subunit f, mitochondrial [Ruditapes philippinarum]|uniref:putative ATP synthase subunit f, mitochondrial n=1 Tax=Ruditapes philippinarum TaxID=129788 RepID=UPI00295C1DB5|nr:putative ATP synthase subunit f, mitochondrial [Ruditapes philippinarum]
MAEVAKQAAEVDPLKPRININLRRFPPPYNPYPVDYNARVHGPYDPARYYGKAKIQSAWDIKLGEIPSKLLAFDRNPRNVFGVFSRCISRYTARHYRAQKMPINFFMQLMFFTMTVNYIATSGFFSTGNGGKRVQRRYRFH